MQEVEAAFAVSPSLDVAYAESLGGPGLDPSNPLTRIRPDEYLILS
jgi:hypothetical protein